MHKDLSERCHAAVYIDADELARNLHYDGQSLALAREAWLSAFDAAAEELDEAQQ